jgi:hypothetical protein
VLQQLDQCSLASTAATCSKFRSDIPAVASKVEVTGTTLQMYASFEARLMRHSTSLTQLEQCCIKLRPSSTQDSDSDLPPPSPGSRPKGLESMPKPGLSAEFSLPHQLPQLRQLHLQGLVVQLGPTNSSPGVLQQCNGLTALDLESCELQAPSTAVAAIAALPGLRSLRLASTHTDRHVAAQFPVGMLLSELQHAPHLTHLSFDFDGCSPPPLEVEELRQLSAFVKLQQIELGHVPTAGLPDGVPAQLVGLTGLHITITQCAGSTASVCLPRGSSGT